MIPVFFVLRSHQWRTARKEAFLFLLLLLPSDNSRVFGCHVDVSRFSLHREKIIYFKLIYHFDLMEGCSASVDTPGAQLDQEISSTPKQLLTELEQWKVLPVNTTESKKKAWLDFLALWSKILQFTPTSAQACYDECTRMLGDVFKSVNFVSITRDAQLAEKSIRICISQLNQPHIKEFIRLPDGKDDSPENQTYQLHVQQILSIIYQNILSTSFRTNEDQQFIDSHAELFTLLIERVDRTMPEHLSSIPEKDYALDKVSERILNILWNLLDQIGLVPTFLKCGLAEKSIRWLGQAALLNDNGRRPLISITHNLARHDDGADRLNEHGAIPVIKQYQKL